MMFFRGKLLLIVAMMWCVPGFMEAPQLLALAEGDKPVELTILYVGDEIGYLEPCG